MKDIELDGEVSEVEEGSEEADIFIGYVSADDTFSSETIERASFIDYVVYESGSSITMYRDVTVEQN